MSKILDKAKQARVVHNACDNLTDLNDHNGALVTLAKAVPGCEQELIAMKIIKTSHLAIGSMNGELTNRRTQTANKIWKHARAHWTNDVDFNLVRSAF